MKNIRLTGEWFDCRTPQSKLTDPAVVQACCVARFVHRHRPIHYAHFTAASNGVIGAITGSNIHLVLRTFPDRNGVTADLFVDQDDPAHVNAAIELLGDLRDAFRPMHALLQRLQSSGQPLPLHGRTASAPTEVFFARPRGTTGARPEHVMEHTSRSARTKDRPFSSRRNALRKLP